MIQKILDLFKELNDKTKKIMKNGFKFCFAFCAIAAFILFIYIKFYSSPELYYIGLNLMQSGIYLFTFFIICGIAVDKIAKQMI